MDKPAGMSNGWYPVWRFRMFRPLTTYPFYHLLNPFVHSTQFDILLIVYKRFIGVLGMELKEHPGAINGPLLRKWGLAPAQKEDSP